MAKGRLSSKFALFLLLLVQLVGAESWAANEARAKDYSKDPGGIVKIGVLGFENDDKAGGDPSALIVPFKAQGACLTYAFDSEKSFAYKVRLALQNAEGNVVDLPIIDVNPDSPTGGVDPDCEEIPPPTAVDDDYGIDFGGKNVLSNDSDPSGLPLTAVKNTEPQKGTVTLNQDGTFVYTPNAGATGEDSFTYFANNGISNSEKPATVSLTLVPPPPVAVDDDYGTDYAGKNVLSNDSDPSGLPLTAVKNTEPQKGKVTLNQDGTFVYTPNAGASGDDSFTYFANNGNSNSEEPATVYLTLVPPPPVAVDDDYGTDYAGKNVLSNDTDPNGLPLTAVKNTEPQKGTVTLNQDGTFVYTPNAGASGDDSFTYFANNGNSNSEEPATVYLTIVPPGTPVAVDDIYVDNFDGKNVLSNDISADGETLTAILVSSPSFGSVVLNSDGTFEYTPGDNFPGEDSFTYKANNGSVDSNVATVTLTIVDPPNRPPVARDDNFGSDYTGKNVLDNDFDPDGDELSAIQVSNASNGDVKLNTDGTFTYTPDEGFTGDDSFTYVANDGELNSEHVATVSLRVEPPNGDPVALPDPFGEDYEGKNVLTNDLPRKEDLTAIKVTDPDNGDLTLNRDGTFVYKPYAGFSGEDAFTYKALNTSGFESESAKVTLKVKETDDTEITGKVDEDGYSVLGNASSNEINVSMRIDEICPKLKPANAGQDDLKQLCDRLRAQGTTARQAVEALGAITPEELAAIPETARIVTQMRSRNMGARLARVRQGEQGLSVSGLNISHGDLQVSGSDLERVLNHFLGSLGGGASADGPGDFGNVGIFIQGDLSFGDQDETALQSGYDYDAQNISVGADYRFGDVGFAGASVSYAWSDVDFDNNAGKTETDSIALAVFGSYYLGETGYIDGVFSYDWSDIETHRKISYSDYQGQVDREAKGDTDGTGYYVSVNAGYGFHWGGFNFIPALSFFYLDGDVDSFQEKGAGGWDLAVDDQGFKSTTLEASAQASYAFSTDWGVLSPYLRMGYNREFEDSAEGIRFNFVNDPDGNNPGGTIRIQSEDPDDNFMMYSAGATAQFKYGISGFVSYQLLGSYDNLNSETVSFGMRWETKF